MLVMLFSMSLVILIKNLFLYEKKNFMNNIEYMDHLVQELNDEDAS